MPRRETPPPETICPKTGRPLQSSARRRRRLWLIWLYPLLGAISLIWFLIRVIPKPSRAAYPCQIVVQPLAASFVTWVVGVLGSIVAFHRARSLLRRSQYVVAGTAILVGCGALYLAVVNLPGETAQAYVYESRYAVNTPNDPIGIAQGLFPGRVVWVHDPDATDWDPPVIRSQYNSRYWWEDGNTDQAVVDAMMSKSIRWLAETSTDEAAWEALFRHFNTSRGLGVVGYQAGDKIAIKINLTVVNVNGYNDVDNDGNQVRNLPWNSASMELIHALLDQLVNVAGVPEEDIFIGDPTCYFPNREYYYLSASFPNVNYMTGRDGKPLPGRQRTANSNVEFHWSTPQAAGYAQDYLPVYYAEAKYFINMAILKAHASGVTLCGKNHYGSLNRRPNTPGYYELHGDLTYRNQSMGSYRTLVDLMGHEHLGGKTLLYMIDGLWGGYNWGGTCPPQRWRMHPFNDDHPNSLFISQDPVAIESVGFDFLWEEDRVSWDCFPWNGTVDATGAGSVIAHMPHLTGTTDYLIEAALAHDPPSGTFYDPEGDGIRMASLGVYEHWNNAADKQYSRNLGIGDGIELITGPPAAEVVGRHVFYNNSAFDGNDPAAGPDDDTAIAPDKTALRAGQATFVNYTSYSKGINGIMIDVRHLAGTPTADDFLCHLSHGDAWTDAPMPSVSVRPGAGVDGSDRITLIWPDGAIVNCWLRVSVRATAETGLEEADEFCFGNLIGETGDSPTEACVTAEDIDACMDNPAGFRLDDFVILKQNFGHSGVGFAGGDYNRDGTVTLDDFVILKQNFGTEAAIDNPYDFNRNGRVTGQDADIAEDNLGACLELISM